MRAHVRGWANPVDPSVVLLEDGQFRLYFTSGPREGGSQPSTYSALSNDGVHFTVEPGVRFQADGMVLDPNVLRAGDQKDIFRGRGTGRQPFCALARRPDVYGPGPLLCRERDYG